jgi:hypothetical protein
MHLRHGRPGPARRYLDQGLALAPGDWRLLAVKARVALAAGRPGEAIALADFSLSRRFDPATLAIAGDARKAAGHPEQAEPYYRALRAAAGTAPRGGFHRTWYLALLDHDFEAGFVLGRVAQDLIVRRDLHGWDLLAWALHRNGRRDEARAAMRVALSFGTDDPDILRHAREIGMDP